MGGRAFLHHFIIKSAGGFALLPLTLAPPPPSRARAWVFTTLGRQYPRRPSEGSRHPRRRVGLAFRPPSRIHRLCWAACPSAAGRRWRSSRCYPPQDAMMPYRWSSRYVLRFFFFCVFFFFFFACISEYAANGEHKQGSCFLTCCTVQTSTNSF